jgi:DNA repair protein RecN (Recombination protein N)
MEKDTMLLELTVQNFTIIEFLHLEWKEGFTVITGETGAGKSILINSLKMISGDKIKPELIRKGADKLKIEAVFDIPESESTLEFLTSLDIDFHDQELILEREMTLGGKNRCRINGSIASLSTMAQLSAHLLDLHGQHRQQSLLHPSTHLSYIDRYGKLEGLLDTCNRQYRKWHQLVEELDTRDKEIKAIGEQRDFFAYQYQELHAARLQEGEEEEIEERLKLLSGLEKITAQIQSGLSILEEENNGVMQQLSSLRKILMYLESRVSAFAGSSAELVCSEAALEEILKKIQSYEVPEEADPKVIDALNARLAQLQKLKSKYKLEIRELIELREKRKTALDQVENFSGLRETLVKDIQFAFKTLCKTALSLSEKRKKAGSRFQKAVNSRLSHLGMEGSTFRCSWKTHAPEMLDTGSLSSNGMDQLEFLLSANPGEEVKPLHHVVSGGEASRIMLAVKTVLSETDPVPLMVFDEIDTGIGGVTANRIGEALLKLSERHQIVAITHLHQVAAHAAWQMKVTKSSSGGRTLTTVQRLSESERVAELARMMGDEYSDTTLEHARQLLAGK